MYADVILPLAVEEPFTYAVPQELEETVRVGMRVVVPLGARKYYTGIVWRLHDVKPAVGRLRAIVSVTDEEPVVGETQFRFWKWLAEYYLCGIGEVMKAALPAALKLAGYTEELDKPRKKRHKAQKTSEFELSPIPSLTAGQRRALDEIQRHFGEKKTTLLHGVTGSGKTEIYIHLIEKTLAEGRDALYLLPEIALTAQLIERLERYFGGRVAVYHSRMTDNMRAEAYLNLLKADRPPMLVLGVRSALLLPHPNLGLIVVDEEHETSYKQQDPAPRYQARDAAIVLGGLCGADVLLGSATPCVESYYNGASEKYGLVSLSERYGGAKLPHVVIADIRQAARRGEKTSHFSHLLLKEIERVLAAGEQAILFQNRRGFAPCLECAACGAIPTCPHCNVSLTWHKQLDSLVCHYCGHAEHRPVRCPACGAEEFRTRGFGTEKVEEELAAIFPDARIERLDLDATRSVRNYQRIVKAFGRGEIDILVGTQMVTKGFDFDRVTLVGVLNADNLLNYPDFRASERAFQLMMQVAGRAGRRQTEGKVIVQTSQPDHPVLVQVRAGDYEAMFRGQLAERQRFFYPPYCRLIRFTLKHTDKATLDRAAAVFAAAMRRIFGRRLLGPETPPVDKVRGEHLTAFLLKIERGKSFAEAKTLAQSVMKETGVTVVADVDPQ